VRGRTWTESGKDLATDPEVKSARLGSSEPAADPQLAAAERAARLRTLLPRLSERLLVESSLNMPTIAAGVGGRRLPRSRALRCPASLG